MPSLSSAVRSTSTDTPWSVTTDTRVPAASKKTSRGWLPTDRSKAWGLPPPATVAVRSRTEISFSLPSSPASWSDQATTYGSVGDAVRWVRPHCTSTACTTGSPSPVESTTSATASSVSATATSWPGSAVTVVVTSPSATASTASEPSRWTRPSDSEPGTATKTNCSPGTGTEGKVTRRSGSDGGSGASPDPSWPPSSSWTQRPRTQTEPRLQSRSSSQPRPGPSILPSDAGCSASSSAMPAQPATRTTRNEVGSRLMDRSPSASPPGCKRGARARTWRPPLLDGPADDPPPGTRPGVWHRPART